MNMILMNQARPHLRLNLGFDITGPNLAMNIGESVIG